MRASSKPKRIISGGQTGVDRAALDVAIYLGIEHGGWCPRGRRAEDGRIPSRYILTETNSERYADRTLSNVRAADATLILTEGSPTGGTALTYQLAQRENKESFLVDLQEGDSSLNHSRVIAWITDVRPEIVNVAGPRETSHPGLYVRAACFLMAVFAKLDT